MRTTTICLLAMMGVAFLAGCGEKKMAITQYPEFYTSDLKAIAVVPFQSEARNPRAGAIVSETFARALQQNGTYKVFKQNDLKAIMDQQDIEIFAGTGDASQAAASFRPGGKVQALMVGTVTMYEVSRDEQPRSDPVYGTDRQGRRVQTGWRNYTVTRIEATVSVSAALIRVSDGTQIHATSMATGKAEEVGELVRRDQHECLRVATEDAVNQLVEQFAVVNKEVSIGKDAIRLARSGAGGQRNFTDKFSVNDRSALLVVTLPNSCDRNAFQWVICRDKGDNELDGDSFLWTRDAGRGGMTWDIVPAQIAQDGGGAGNYTAQLLSGTSVVATRKFKLEKAKDKDQRGGSTGRIERPQRGGRGADDAETRGRGDAERRQR